MATWKLQASFIGPYTIIRKVSPVAYKLELPANFKIHPVFHISLLKRFREDEEQVHSKEAPPVPEIVGEDVEYEVETILDKWIVRRQVQYLVKWEGYPYYEASWEPLSHLSNCAKLINRFEKLVTPS